MSVLGLKENRGGKKKKFTFMCSMLFVTKV